MVVVDACALLALFTAPAPVSQPIAERLVDEEPAAVHLVDAEVLHGLRGLLYRREIRLDRALVGIDTLRGMALTRYPHTALLTRAFALRHNMSAYDALYVALAEVLECPLVTSDRRLGHAVGDLVDVEVFDTG